MSRHLPSEIARRFTSGAGTPFSPASRTSRALASAMAGRAASSLSAARRSQASLRSELSSAQRFEAAFARAASFRMSFLEAHLR